MLLQSQKHVSVLSTVYKWLKHRLQLLTPIIKANTYYQQFQQLYFDQNSHLFQTQDYSKKSSSKLNPVLTKLAFVCLLNSFMLLLIKRSLR